MNTKVFLIIFGLFFISGCISPVPKAPAPVPTNTPIPISTIYYTPEIYYTPGPTPIPTSTIYYIPEIYYTPGPTPIPTSTEVTKDELEEIVKNELKKLANGQVLFNPPQEMIVGKKERVEVRIIKGFTKNLTKGLKGKGEPRIENISVGTFMKVHMTGNNFEITPLSDENQLVGDDITQWDYDVMPLESGNQLLELTVIVRIKILNDGEETIDYPVFDRLIKVKVNMTYSIIKFIGTNWQWIISTIIGSGVIGWFVIKWRKSKSNEKEIKELKDEEGMCKLWKYNGSKIEIIWEAK